MPEEAIISPQRYGGINFPGVEDMRGSPVVPPADTNTRPLFVGETLVLARAAIAMFAAERRAAEEDPDF